MTNGCHDKPKAPKKATKKPAKKGKPTTSAQKLLTKNVAKPNGQ
jgi:hypothetical protein